MYIYNGLLQSCFRCHGYTQATLLNSEGLAIQLIGCTLVSRACLGHVGLLRFPPALGGYPPWFYLLTGGWVYYLAPEAALIRGMPMGPKVFLAMPDACGLHPATGPTLNNGLVPDLYAGGAYDEYPGVTGSVLSYCLSYFFVCQLDAC